MDFPAYGGWNVIKVDNGTGEISYSHKHRISPTIFILQSCVTSDISAVKIKVIIIVNLSIYKLLFTNTLKTKQMSKFKRNAI